jgi:hypothetical protein
VESWKKTYEANHSPKQAGVAIHFLDNADFKLTLSNEIKMETPY